MAMRNPKGRVNYEPNSWRRESAGRAKIPSAGFRTVAEPTRTGESGACARRSFADHYSQARQFFVSQTDDRAGAHRRRVRASS